MTRILSMIGLLLILLALCGFGYLFTLGDAVQTEKLLAQDLIKTADQTSADQTVLAQALLSQAETLAQTIADQSAAVEDLGDGEVTSDGLAMVQNALKQAQNAVSAALEAAEAVNELIAAGASQEEIAQALELAEAALAEAVVAQDNLSQALEALELTQLPATEEPVAIPTVVASTLEATTEPSLTNTPAPSTPTPSATPTATPMSPPDTLPPTGNVAAQPLPPTVSAEVEYPSEMEIFSSSDVIVTLIQVSEEDEPAPATPTPQPDTVIVVVTVEPIRGSQPGASIDQAFGPEYEGFVVARLLYGVEIFDVSPAEPRIEALEGLERGPITFQWNITAKKGGEQSINLDIKAEWRPRDGSGTPKRHDIWPVRDSELMTQVNEPLIVRGHLNILSLVAVAIGSVLNLPWIYEQVTKRLKKKEEDQA